MFVFLSIATVGLFWLLMALIFGHDHDVEHEVDHETGHGEHDTGGDAPTVSLFSSKVIATLIMGFGVAGGIASYQGESWVASSLWGLGSGFILAALMYGFMVILYGQQASSIIPTAGALGKQGEVTVTIGDNATGEVGLTVNNSYLTYSARTADGTSIQRGQIVYVREVVGSTLIVQTTRPTA